MKSRRRRNIIIAGIAAILIIGGFVVCGLLEMAEEDREQGPRDVVEVGEVLYGDYPEKQKTSDEIKLPHEDSIPVIYKRLLEKAQTQDSLEFKNLTPFMVFKSGYFLDPTQKLAMVITSDKDTTFTIELLAQKGNNWEPTGNKLTLDIFKIQYGHLFEDYNFDGQKDIYIQVTISNGYSMCRGNLITIDPVSKNMTLHEEARDLANIKRDPANKSIISDAITECKAMQEICKWTNKWKNGKLVTVKKDCPC